MMAVRLLYGGQELLNILLTAPTRASKRPKPLMDSILKVGTRYCNWGLATGERNFHIFVVYSGSWHLLQTKVNYCDVAVVLISQRFATYASTLIG